MIKRLARCIREYKLPAILGPVCMIGEVAMEVLIPLVMAKLYDYGIAQQDMAVVVRQSLLLMLCAVTSLCFGSASAVFASKAGTGFAKNLRHDMYYHVQEFSFSNIDKFSTASIVTRLTSDVANIQMAFQMMIRMAIRCPMMLVLTLISAMRISVKLSLVYCVALPILALVLIGLIPVVFKIFDQVFKTYDNLNNVVQENIHGIRVVKSFVREDRETEKFTGISGDIYRLFCKAEHILALNNPVMQLCVYGCMLAISWFGAKLVIASGNIPGAGLTTGELSSMFTYTTQILSSLMMLSMVFVMMVMSRAPMRRCAELLAEEPNLVSPEHPVTEVKDGSIDFENVSFRYSATAKLDALHDVNLHIHEENLQKDCCISAFLRGVFLICGTVTDPQKEYHLEFSTPYLHLAEDLVAVLHCVKAAQLSPSIARRKNSYIVYIKESAAIEDFLTLTGAVNSAMNLMQIKMYKETYNNLNRVSNCETANLDKTYSAATKQIAAIALISDKVGLDELPADLREAAVLRLENPEMSLREMGERLSISRSGVNHRLRRILEFAEQLGSPEESLAEQSVFEVEEKLHAENAKTEEL